jgi:CRP-like cAMP-binding protein
MTPEDLLKLEAAGVATEVVAGRVLIEHDQHASGLYVVLAGTVLVEAPEGSREFGAGSVIGERALFSEEGRRTARVTAATNVRLAAVQRVEVERLCADDESFAERLAAATQ